MTAGLGTDAIAAGGATGRRWWLYPLIGYVALLLAVTTGMIRGRSQTVADLSNAKSAADWENWRDDVRQQQTRPGSVSRRVPPSAEPPALVLMRDYFAVSLAAAVVFTSVLYWVITWFVRGIIASSRTRATAT